MFKENFDPNSYRENLAKEIKETNKKFMKNNFNILITGAGGQG